IVAPFAKRLLVGFCAHEGQVDVRLSAINEGLDGSTLAAIGEEIKQALGDDFSHFGEEGVPSLLVRQLRDRTRTLAVAESCTGGLLASRFTDVPGASRVFMGGVV